jgi:hypothetical protein
VNSGSDIGHASSSPEQPPTGGRASGVAPDRPSQVCSPRGKLRKLAKET